MMEVQQMISLLIENLDLVEVIIITLFRVEALQLHNQVAEA